MEELYTDIELLAIKNFERKGRCKLLENGDVELIFTEYPVKGTRLIKIRQTAAILPYRDAKEIFRNLTSDWNTHFNLYFKKNLW